MLVLGRKSGESIVIGDDIVITILGVDRDQVKIGVKAPREIRILREEVFKAVLEQQEIALRLEQGEMLDQLGELRQFLLTEFDSTEKAIPEE